MRIDLLKALCGIPSVSGFEEPIRNYLMDIWKDYLSESLVDGLGNLIGMVKSHTSVPEKLTILLMAHMDEVGLIVRDITEDGYIHFDTLGGQTDEVLAGQIWEIHTDDGLIIGYTGLESGHTMSHFPPTSKINQKSFFIDVGAQTRAEAEKMGIRTGLSITYGGPSFIQNNHRILAKALDDRFALALITELLETLAKQSMKLPFNLLIAATTQEELGMRGAMVINHSLALQPDIVINLDIGLARDYPLLYSQASETPPTSTVPKLGEGFTLTAYDSSMLANPRLIKYMTELARKNNINYQIDSSTLSSQDGCCLQQSNRGIPVINIGIPVRYAHSHLNMMDTRDFDSLLLFLIQFCKTYNLDIHQQLFPKMNVSKIGLYALAKQYKEPESFPLPRINAHSRMSFTKK